MNQDNKTMTKHVTKHVTRQGESYHNDCIAHLRPPLKRDAETSALSEAAQPRRLREQPMALQRNSGNLPVALIAINPRAFVDLR